MSQITLLNQSTGMHLTLSPHAGAPQPSQYSRPSEVYCLSHHYQDIEDSSFRAARLGWSMTEEDTSSSDTGRSHSVMNITQIEMKTCFKKTTGDQHIWVSHAVMLIFLTMQLHVLHVSVGWGNSCPLGYSFPA